MRRSLATVGLALLLSPLGGTPGPAAARAAGAFRGLAEVNPPAGPDAGDAPVALVGARLIDGRGGPPVPDAVVVVRGGRIAAVGPRATTPVPDGARVHDAAGLSALPGLIDTHFHNDRGDPAALPALVLSRGVTTLRDPGLPVEVYDAVRRSDRPMPRCFLTGRHLDQEPHAYPDDAVAVPDADAARSVVAGHLRDGASAIKVYFRLPPELIRVACEAAHARGVPVTAHLELVDADAAIRAGLDGIEHVTSCGTALATPEAADRFRDAVRRDNAARRDGRYRLWADLDLDEEANARVRPRIDLMLERGVVLSPTLAIFEHRPGDRDTEGFHVEGFRNMLRFVGQCHRAGVPVVVGSHSSVPHAERGWAYQRELELLVESGLSPGEAIQAATLRGARFLGCADRLGSLEPGKRADLVLVEGDPLADIAAMRSVRHVMLDGRWVGAAPAR